MSERRAITSRDGEAVEVSWTGSDVPEIGTTVTIGGRACIVESVEDLGLRPPISGLDPATRHSYRVWVRLARGSDIVKPG